MASQPCYHVLLYWEGKVIIPSPVCESSKQLVAINFGFVEEGELGAWREAFADLHTREAFLGGGGRGYVRDQTMMFSGFPVTGSHIYHFIIERSDGAFAIST